ncbi:gluconolaconase [Aestuariicella hydrocarbonica]|uniref:Gluconolaconase n=1 Tax=Pseudomaricurvus hydrocarbonicus TaxID=1470433 RepID=A0A9E5JSI1_9GAMM|nr:SMP-30/gluconolactonase/LRE family protein [Aestuariicella hydrocarbonica]NHO65973.1 gluconolaconase [Aestuariicella hydrocarbonica]
MSFESGRYTAGHAPSVADGWKLERLTEPSRLYGANGIRTGADGRIYVAQVSGSQISAIDVNSGAIDIVSPMGGDIIGPDDLVFDDHGNMFVTEFTEGRVSVRETNGRTRVVHGNLPSANPITVYNGRLFTGECRPDGRLLELDLYGGEPRIILENVPMPNAMEVGPDGKLYVPIMGTNEIWRVDFETGAREVVATELGVPDSVKFDAQGFIVSTQVGSGEVLRINPNTGEKTVLASIAPGLDNCTFVGERLFVSSISGQINEVLPGGELRSLIHDGLQWPLGLAVAEDGVLFVADGGYNYALKPGGELNCIGMLFTPGCPGYVRGVVADAQGQFLVTTAMGQVSRWNPAQQQSEVLAEGFDRLYGLAKVDANTVIVAECGTGKVLAISTGQVRELASGLNEPMGVALTADGTCLVSEEGAGRVVKITAAGAETLVDDLQQPQGILVVGEMLYIVDAGAKELVAVDLSNHSRSVLAADLPVGPPQGVVPKFLRGVPPLSGPMGLFAGIAAGSDGTLYVSADAEGSVLAVRPER